MDDAFAAIDRARDLAERNLRNARELFESYLQGVFEGPEWKSQMLGEIASHKLGKMLDRNKNKGAPQKYLRNINIRWFKLDFSNLNEMPFEPNEHERYSVLKGDLLICEGGYPGRAAIYDEDYPMYFQKAIHRVRFNEPNHNKWCLYYLFYLHQCGKLSQYFTGTGIQHFTGEALRKLPIPVPSKKEVEKFLLLFDNIHSETQRLEAIYRKKLDDLEELKKSVLEKAFRGELVGELEKSH